MSKKSIGLLRPNPPEAKRAAPSKAARSKLGSLALCLAFIAAACVKPNSSAPPTLDSLEPVSASALGGTTITLSGTALLETSASPIEVTFDGMQATNVTLVDGMTVTCVAPPGTPGASVEVELRGPNGSDSLPGGFTYHEVPELGSASIVVGSSVGGEPITLTGTGFEENGAGSTFVEFGGVSASNVIVVDDSTITCDIPPGTPGSTVDIVVSNANGLATLAGMFSYYPAPSLTSISITEGTSLGGSSVTLTGTGFVANSAGANIISFGGTQASDIVIVNDTTATCTTPAGPPATDVDVVLSNGNGSTILASGFLYFATPAIASITPASATPLGGSTLTLMGTGFIVNGAGANSVTFGGVPATDVMVVDDTTLTCTAPAGVSGTAVDVTVTNANGAGTLALGFTYNSSTTVASIAPNSGSSLGGTSVTISGTSFQLGAGVNTVTFDGVSATSIVVVDDSTMTCDVPAGTPSATVDVVVSNTNGTGTLVSGYRYHALPTLTAVSPPAGSPLGGTAVTLTGSGFQDDAPGTNSVTFGGVSAVSIVVVNDTTITCTTPSGPDGMTVDVALSNTNGSATIVGGFTYDTNPLLVSVTPSSGTSLGGTSVTLSGTAFTANGAGPNSVTFGGVAPSNLVTVNDSTITCDTPVGTPGASVNVSVMNANGTTTLVGGFRFHAIPTLTSVAPVSGSSLGSTSVTLTGTGFQTDSPGVNSVTFGGIAATNISVVNDTTMTCDSPAGTRAAVVDIALSNTNGSDSLTGAFRYHLVPTLTAIAPTAGTSLGSTTVTLTGTGFQVDSPGTNAVTFDGSPATNVMVVDDSTLTCDSPAGTQATSVDVVLTNDNGSDTLSSAYAYHPTPTATAISANTGSSLGGTSVTITGTGFVVNAAGTNTVQLDGTDATAVVVVNDTTITCTTPAGPAGTAVDVVVNNDNGSGTLSSGFTYFPTPTVTSVSPAVGTSLGGTNVSVTGTGFTANTAGSNFVTFDGVSATNVVVIDDSTITCTTPAGPAGTAVDLIVNNDNGSGTLSSGFSYFSAPTTTNVTPSAGTSLGGVNVTVTGSGFTANTAGLNAVTFDGISATGITVVNDTTITCTTPAGPAGSTVVVAVSNDNGTGALAAAFDYYPTPVINSVSPSAGSSLGGTSVTLSGTRFQANGAGANSVTFGGVAATAVVRINDTTITCNAPAGVAGSSVDVSVSNANGSSTAVGGFTYHVTPAVTSVTPAAGTSMGGTSVTLSGSGFLSNGAGGNAITFGGVTAGTIVVLSDTTITCTTPAGVAGTAVDVVVTNANGVGTLSSGFSFHAEPVVLSVTPASGTSLGGVSVTITGTGFSDNAPGTNVVTFGGVIATGIIVGSDTSITCDLPPGTAGSAVVVMVSNDNGSGTLNPGFTYHGLPTLTSVAPSSGTSLGGTSVTLTGSGFQDNGPGTNTVTFDGVAATGVMVISDTTITCDTPSGSAGSTVDLQVQNANGTATLANGFTYLPAPTITSITAASGRWQGGITVTIAGTGFTANAAGTSVVELDGVAATSVTVMNDTTITCDTPAGTPGSSVNVTVANNNGTGTLSSGYRYFAQPTLTSVTSSAGSSLGGTSVTISGSGFVVDSPGPNILTFGGAAPLNVMIVSDTTITCDTPAGTEGMSVDVVLSNSNGSDTLTAGYAYYDTPLLASISPSVGGSTGGTSVTLSGRGFVSNSPGTTTVTFGGVAATNLVVLNDTTITCEAPAGAPGAAVDVVLSNANGSDTKVNGFSYHPPPSLLSVAPTSGSSLGGQPVTLTGSGFLDNSAGASTVTFGGVAATELVVLTDTSITCQPPAGTPGATVDIVLQNASGSATLASSFTYHVLPTLTSVSPTAVTSLGGTSVTLAGTGFQDDSPGINAVTFGGNAATNVVVVSDISITCDVPAGTPGSTVDVVLTNKNGSATLANGLSYYGEPTLTSVAPTSGTSLATTSVTLTGTGFQANSAGMNSVTFGGVAATSVMVGSDTSITCDAPAGPAGTTVNVVLTNSNGAVTLVSGFRYHDEPTLTSLSPTAGSPTGGTSVTLTGTGFQDDLPGTTAVTFGGVAATSVMVVSDTSVTCDAPAGAAGTFVDVVLSNDNGADSLVNAFTFYAQPTLTGVTPDHGPDSGSTSVTLTGTGFQNNFPGTNTVTFDGVAATSIIVVSDSSITCDTPAGTAGAPVDVVVSNDNGSDTLPNSYSYYPPPTLASVTPAAGTSLGGTSVSLTGTGFLNNDAGTNAVTFDGNAATGVVVGSDSSITCSVPSGMEGTSVDVVVTNSNGSVTLSSGFTYYAAPTLATVVPGFGVADGGTSVTLTGTGFLDNAAGTNTVTIGGNAPTDVVVVNDTTITCDTPAGGGDSTADVIVSNANGAVTLTNGFRYNDPPKIGPVLNQWAEESVAFSYTPPSSDPDGTDTPLYSSTGTALPGWATLNTGTGAITGTPGAGDVGVTTSGIVITIDDSSNPPVASGSFAIAVSGAASALVFGTAPAANEPQDELWTPFTVRVEDTSGNLVGTWSNAVTLTKTAGVGTLSGTLAQSPLNGIATFDDISHNTQETVTFDLTSPGVTSLTGTSVTIDSGPSTKLSFAVQPATIEYRGHAFSYIVVEVQDAAGDRIASDNTTQVDLALAVGGGTLSGTLSKTVNAGRAVFDDLSYSLAGIISLNATSTPATTAPDSDDITIRLNPGSNLPQIRTSIDSVGGEGNGSSSSPAVSSNGRHFAFASDATDLVAGDTNAARDIFVHDRQTGDTERVSVDSLATQSNGASDAPSISADGRFIAFESLGTNLVASDTNAVSDIFVHDRETGTTTRISLDSTAGDANGENISALLSTSGRFVAFESAATDIVAGDSNANRDIFLHDRATSLTTRVSLDSLGNESNGDSMSPAISHDGLSVAFTSMATNLVAGDTNGVTDVFVRETTMGTTTRASVATGGTQADGPSSEPALSGDGDVVAFTSSATNLVAADTNGAADVFVRERVADLTTRASLSNSEEQANGASQSPAISEDGDRVAFASVATNLVLGDTNASQDVFLRRRANANTIQLSTATTGGGGNGLSSTPALSANGAHSVYASAASDLVSGDTNGADDAIASRIHGLPTATSVSTMAGTSLGGTSLTVTGTGFQANNAGVNNVFFDGVGATSVVVVNDATITCDTPAGTAGATVDVVVVNSNGTGVLTDGYSYHPTPTVTMISPMTGATVGGTGITVTGTGFASLGFGANSVSFGGNAATNVVAVNDTTITCDTPAGNSGTTVDVAVTNLNGTGTLSSAFSYHTAPTLASVSPATGHADGGEMITLTGTGFTANGVGANAVTFGGVPATTIVTVNDTTITCNTPAGNAGTSIDVVVQNANGTATLPNGFGFNPEPALTSIAPAAGSPLGGTGVTLTGTGFQNNSTGTTSVTFGGVAATSVVVLSDTSITCNAPAGTAESTVHVALTNDNGNSLLASAYTYNPEPVLTGVAPSAGTSLGGNSITLTGTGFSNGSVGTTMVTVDGAMATSVVVVNDTTVTCDTPAGAASTTVDVALANGNGASIASNQFTYHPTPTVASLSPSSGALAGGTSITISGTGFISNDAGTNSVTIGGAPATSVVVLNNTTIRCTAPPGAASGPASLVVSNANGSATLTNGFTYNNSPTLTSVSPSVGSPLGGTRVTLTGTGFVDNGAGANTVTFNGNVATNLTAVNDTTILCDTPTGTPGAAVDVVVSNANDQALLSGGFTYHPSPSIASTSPSAGTSLGGTSITITGTGFVANNAGTNGVLIGGNPAANVVTLSDTSITCTSPAGIPGSAVDVVISNDNSDGALVGGFAYHSAPTATMVAPSVGSSLGGTSITLTGTGFVDNDAGTNSVLIGGAAATNVVAVSDTMITCDTPAGTPGASVDIVVQNDNGSASQASAFAYYDAPSVTTVVPGAGSSLGGTSITITGTGFTANDAGPATVFLDGNAATNVVVANDTTVTCDSPAGTPGAAVTVEVQNSNGSGALGSAFSYHPLPTLTTVTPSTGSSLGGTSITLTGSGFTLNGAGPATVLIDGNPASNVVVTNDTTISCDTPAGTPSATFGVEIQNANGSASLASSFSYFPIPTLASVSPADGSPQGGTSVTLSGTGFLVNGAGTNSVSIDGNAATSVVVVNDNTVTCVTPPGMSGGNVDVIVSNDNGSGLGSNLFTYRSSPTVTGVAPGAGSFNGGTAVTVTGTGFVNQSAGSNTVTIDGADATDIIVVGDTTITCVVPAGTAGLAADVAVTNDNGPGILAGGFQYHAAPAVTLVSPASGPMSGGTNLTITGSGFTANDAGVTSLTIGGLSPSSITIVNDTTITCTSLGGAPGSTLDLVVMNDNGTGTLANGFRYHVEPTLTGVLPVAGTPLGGESVTLSGTGFQVDSPGAIGVTFDGVVATNVAVTDDTTLTCNAPAGTAGSTVDVSISNANGTDVLPSSFSFHPSPTVTSVAPTDGSSLGGTNVTLTGTGFVANAAGTNSVTFDGNSATAVVVVNDTTLTCDTPAGSSGATVDLVVSNDNGSDSLSSAFSYFAAPAVISVSLSSGPKSGGTSVTLSGSGFVANAAGTNSVTVGSNAATSIIVVDDGTITCEIPAGTPGMSVDLVVTNDNGSGTLSSGFSYHAEPTVSGVTPAAGPAMGGTSVTLTGTGFMDFAAGTNTVKFDGNAATSVVVTNDTTLTCITPSGNAASDIEVQVENDNGSGSLPSGFRYRSNIAGDLDDDGVADLIIGAPGTATGDGELVLFLGDALGLSDTSAAAADLRIAPSLASGASLGASIASGDINGDGAIDLAVGAPGDTVVYVFFGPLSTPATLSTSAADVTIDGAQTDDDFGAALAVDDVDGDGQPDLIVGAPLANADDRGAIYVFEGGPAFLPMATTDAGITIEGAAGEELGSAIALGDLDGDGNADLAGAAVAVDRVYLFLGGGGLSSTNSPAADATFDGAAAGDSFGRSLAIGDLGGDSRLDLLVGAPLADGVGLDSGAAYVFFGSATPAGGNASTADVALSAEAAGDRLGAAVGTGDLDGDGNSDLIVSAPFRDFDVSTFEVGRVYVFLGGTLGATEAAGSADAHYTGEPTTGEHLGMSLSVLDLEDDGFGDLIIGAPDSDGTAMDAGRVYVFNGAALLIDDSATSDDATYSGVNASDGLGSAIGGG